MRFDLCLRGSCIWPYQYSRQLKQVFKDHALFFSTGDELRLLSLPMKHAKNYQIDIFDYEGNP